MAIEVVDLPPIMVIFYSYVSLPEGNKGPQLFEPLRFYPTKKKIQDFGVYSPHRSFRSSPGYTPTYDAQKYRRSFYRIIIWIIIIIGTGDPLGFLKIYRIHTYFFKFIYILSAWKNVYNVVKQS